MIRRILIYGLLLALPFILYWAWMAFVRRRQAEAGGVWNDAPLTWLLISGILLVLATLGATAFMSGSLHSCEIVVLDALTASSTEAPSGTSTSLPLICSVVVIVCYL